MPQTEILFRQVLLEAVDEGLLVLGTSSRIAIYFHLIETCSLGREDIPDKPDVFVLGLQKIFGRGSKVIEKSIVENLYRKLGIKYEKSKSKSFEDYLNEACKMMEKKQSNDQRANTAMISRIQQKRLEESQNVEG